MGRWHLKEVREQVLGGWPEHPQPKERQGWAEPAWWVGEQQGAEAAVGHVRGEEVTGSGGNRGQATGGKP